MTQAVIISVVLALLTACSFALVYGERKARRQTERELKEAKENADRTAEIISRAEKDKAGARTGDGRRDLDYMAGKLHEYAEH